MRPLLYALLLLLGAGGAACAGPDRGDSQGAEAPRLGSRERVVWEAEQLVGVREKTGRNDGPVVEAILASVGLDKGPPWCAAFNFYVYEKAGLAKAVPRSAWSPDWVARPTWTRARGGQTPKPGDSFGIYFASKGRVAHTGLIYRWGDTVITCEGNTGPSGSVGEADRNGDGVYKKRRSPRQIYAVRNWID